MGRARTRAAAASYNEFVQGMQQGTESGGGSASPEAREELITHRLRDAYYKWRLRSRVESEFDLGDLQLTDMSSNGVDAALNGEWAERLRQRLLTKYGTHACGTKGENCSGGGDWSTSRQWGLGGREGKGGRPSATATVAGALCGAVDATRRITRARRDECPRAFANQCGAHSHRLR